MLAQNETSYFYQFLRKIAKSWVRSGISIFDLLKLRNDSSGKPGNIKFFGKRIKYSNPPAFLHSVEELFLDEVYKFESKNEQPYIIDCGANIGLSICYFKKLYPNSKILAFEPDPIIFQMLKYNVEEAWGFKDVILENKAVWYEPTTMDFFPDGSLAGSLVVNFNNSSEEPIKIPVVDLRPYLENQTIDFLKIDIEGAENELIPKLENYLGNVENFFLEYHSITNKSQALPEILEVLKNEGFRGYIKEAAIITNRPFIERSRGVFDMQLNMFFYR